MENRICLNSNSFHGFSLDQALEGAAAAGFNCIELCAVKGWTEHIMPGFDKKAIDRLREKLDSLGLNCIALSAHCNLMDARRLEDFRASIVLAADLGCVYIISSAGEAHFGKNEVFADDALAKNVIALLPDLEQYKLTLALEVHGEYGTGESLKKIVQKTGSDLVGINYDTGNVMFYGGENPEEEIKSCAEYVKFVHLKDKIGGKKEWNFPAPGSGELKLREFITFLNNSGYRGPYSVEIEYTENFTMNPKKPEDIAIANQAAKDAFAYLSGIG